MPSVGARVFVGIDVGEAVRREAARVVATLAGKLEAVKKPPKVTWVKPAALHLTIRFIGEVEPERVEALASLLMAPIRLKPFDVQWRGIGTFPNSKHPRALWLGVISGAAQLAEVEAEVSRRVAGAQAVEIEGRPLLPHLTLGRVKMAGEGVDWPKILQASEVKQAVTRVDRVVLYQS
ncbi:MAG TPA: RNA 2',3'-cyclic phosphodiesterase, partial [Vicinamibacterales bacterium]|nr:RNA 2',3'-cyclic phosphodiesterase [Vicinamibacterales bacterium]